MGWFDRLFKGSGKPRPAAQQGDPNAIWLYVRCGKCGTPVRVRIDRRNDLSREEGPGVFFVRKQIMDDKCFRMMEAELWFDSKYAVVSSEMHGGTILSEEEYKAARSA